MHLADDHLMFASASPDARGNCSQRSSSVAAGSGKLSWEEFILFFLEIFIYLQLHVSSADKQ